MGGAVRDVLLSVPSVDWDLATRARPGQVRRLFRRTVPIGIEHGTVGVLARDGTLYEVTTFRRDVETHGRHAVVEFAETLEEDLSRRDFTINAVAWHPLRDELRDPFGGVQDLEDGILRTVGDPGARFSEDYLRVLRALRFAGRFDLEVHPETWRSLVQAVAHLDVLSRERVREELLKVLGADPDPSRTLSLYRASGALAATLPELARAAGSPLPGTPALDVWSYGVAMVHQLSPSRPMLRLTGLLQGIGLPDEDPSVPGGAILRSAGGGDARAHDPGREDRRLWSTERAVDRAAALLVRLRFSNALAARVAALVRAGPVPPPVSAGAAGLRRWLAWVGPDRFRDLVRLWSARARVLAEHAPTERDRVLSSVRALRAVLSARPALAVTDLAIGGKDLIRLGMKPGPGFGRVLEGLLGRVLADPSLNERDRLLEIVREEQGRDTGPGGAP